MFSLAPFTAESTPTGLGRGRRRRVLRAPGLQSTTALLSFSQPLRADNPTGGLYAFGFYAGADVISTACLWTLNFAPRELLAIFANDYLFLRTPYQPRRLTQRWAVSLLYESQHIMAEEDKECVVCWSEEDEETQMILLPCGNHHVCKTSSPCLEGFFRDAMNEEKSYPPRCCNAVLLIQDYEEILPWDFQWQFLLKIREYSVVPKTRVYCGNQTCGNFLHTENYEDVDKHTIAVCNACLFVTCTKCKKSLFDSKPPKGCPKKLTEDENAVPCSNAPGKRCTKCAKLFRKTVEDHKCEIPEEDIKFELAAQKYEYQTCPGCKNIVELAEACNHINCSCGQEFCYVCGRSWSERWNLCLHGCPQYGKPRYDAEGYNVGGYHRDTGLNRDGRSLAEVEDMHDSEDEEDEVVDKAFWLREQIPGITDDLVETLLALPQEERELAIAQARFHADAQGEIPLGAQAAPAGHADDAGQVARPAQEAAAAAMWDEDGHGGWGNEPNIQPAEQEPVAVDLGFEDAAQDGDNADEAIVNDEMAEPVPT